MRQTVEALFARRGRIVSVNGNGLLRHLLEALETRQLSPDRNLPAFRAITGKTDRQVGGTRPSVC